MVNDNGSDSSFVVRIEKIVAGGDGLGRHEGRVVFVPGTAPGERHRVEAKLEKRDYIKARSLARLDDAETRREPPCPYQSECGGCSLMHLRVDAQLEAKREILRESLERAGFEGLEATIETRSANELGYRSRLRFHAASRFREPILGFRQRGSRRIVDIERCALGTPELNEVWSKLRRWIARKPALGRHLVGIELFEDVVGGPTGEAVQQRGRSEKPPGAGRFVARFVVRRSDGLRKFGAQEKRSLMDEIGLSGFVAEPENGWGRVRAGKALVHHTCGEYRWQQSVGSFFQANRFLLAILIEEAVPRETVERAFDLFCGVGFFTLPLSKIADTVVGVESSLSAVKDARANAKQSGSTNIRFEHGDTASFLEREKLLPSDFVLVDPPREGLGKAIIDRLGEAELDELRYVSCDPAAFARDAALLSRRGYVLERLSLVDLFPNTHHFEIASRWTARSTPRT